MRAPPPIAFWLRFNASNGNNITLEQPRTLNRQHMKTWRQQLKSYTLWLKPANSKPQTASTRLFNSSRNCTRLCSTSFLMAGRLVIARSPYCCLCRIVPECSCFICPNRRLFSTVGNIFQKQETDFLWRSLTWFCFCATWLVVCQIATPLMRGFISWRGVTHCHMLLTIYVCMHLYVHVSYRNVQYRRLCAWNIGVSISS